MIFMPLGRSNTIWEVNEVPIIPKFQSELQRILCVICDIHTCINFMLPGYFIWFHLWVELSNYECLRGFFLLKSISLWCACECGGTYRAYTKDNSKSNKGLFVKFHLFRSSLNCWTWGVDVGFLGINFALNLRSFHNNSTAIRYSLRFKQVKIIRERNVRS